MMLKCNIQYACGECGTSVLACESCKDKRIAEFEAQVAEKDKRIAWLAADLAIACSTDEYRYTAQDMLEWPMVEEKCDCGGDPHKMSCERKEEQP